jgi:uncharacterized protein involved in exopolysaccharide biosynthesis
MNPMNSSERPAAEGAQPVTERSGSTVYVVSPDVVPSERNDTIDLEQLRARLWKGKKTVISVGAATAAIALCYVLLAPSWYRADIVLMPVDSKSAQGVMGGQLGGLGGLASVAGITIGEGATAEPLAVLKSRDFTAAFITDYDLIPVMFPRDWDAVHRRWKSSDPEGAPDIHDAVKFFDEDIRHIQEDKKTRLVTLSIEWTDPKLAASWANVLVKRLNERMRDRLLREAAANIAYLKGELAATNVVSLQQAVGRLLESEMQKEMLARVNEEAAFRVIDPAQVPKWRSRPRRVLIVALASVAGVVLGSIVVLLGQSLRKRRAGSATPGSS